VKNFLQRLRAAWAAFLEPEAVTLGSRVNDVYLSPIGSAARRAVAKNEADPSFHPTKDHVLKRNEALQWAETYCREDNVPFNSWVAGFVIELEVGLTKGKL
jgi:hypothetical protein